VRLRLGKRKSNGAASIELVMASAIAIPIAGAILFMGFRICSYVFSALSGSISMPFV
jgi:ABC-type tungstate transport system substrate-binding protein